MKLVHYDFSAPVEIKNNFLCLTVENIYRRRAKVKFRKIGANNFRFIFAVAER